MNNFLNTKTLIFVLLFVLNSSVHSSTISQKSKISVYQGHNRISFFINSDITESILVDFEKLLQQYPNHVGANVYLNSPGGSVFVGLKLGYIFRSHKMRLFVGTERNGVVFLQHV
jgi:ATP-dependent protease ClpP protease subunit